MEELHLVHPKNADFVSNDSDSWNVSLMSSNGIVQPVRISSFHKPGREHDGHRELSAFSTLNH